MTWQPHDAEYHRAHRRSSALLDLGEVLSTTATMAAGGVLLVVGAGFALGVGLVGVGVKTIKRAVAR